MNRTLGVFLIFGLCLSSCGGRVLAERSVGPHRVVIRGPGDAYAEELPQIIDRVSEAIEAAALQIALDPIELTLAFDARRAIPGWGVGGYSPGTDTLWMSLDPELRGTPGLIDERLPRMVVHELHHAARWRGPGYGFTLLDAMVAEGLADHFAVQVLGGAPAPWTDALDDAQRAVLQKRAAKQLDLNPYSHAGWFFGAEEDIPNWAGYTLGFELVAEYLARQPGATAASLVDAPSARFRPEW